MNRKVCSPTQPGRGIRKIADLFHDLPDLVDKAERHDMMERLGPDSDEMKKVDAVDFLGMTEGAINEERQEYVHDSEFRCMIN
jgi:hypothetical protein